MNKVAPIDRAVDRAHAADDDHHQNVHHDGEGERGVRPGVAQPQGVERARRGGQQRREAIGEAAVNDDAVAERLGAERILADRLQHAPERRVDDAQQQQDQRRAPRNTR
jgi:hypothetical protein